MQRVLHQQHAMSDRFITYLPGRNIRIEADLVDQLFNQCEKRLARALLLLARYGKEEVSNRVLPRISQTMLAELIGATRSRVSFFMNKFRKLGFIDYNGGLKVNHSLLSIVLHDGHPAWRAVAAELRLGGAVASGRGQRSRSRRPADRALGLAARVSNMEQPPARSGGSV